MLLKPTPVSTERFTWMPDERLFVAEDSDLPRPSRIWDDACDEGYCLVSKKTGKCMVIAVDEVVKDEEGDLLYWTLRPIARQNRNLFSVRVFND